MKALAEINEGMQAWVGLKVVEVGEVNGQPCIKLSNGVMLAIDSQLV